MLELELMLLSGGCGRCNYFFNAHSSDESYAKEETDSDLYHNELIKSNTSLISLTSLTYILGNRVMYSLPRRPSHMISAQWLLEGTQTVRSHTKSDCQKSSTSDFYR